MSIIGNPITLGGGGGELNIDYGMSEPADTSKIWIPLVKKPDNVEVTPFIGTGKLSSESLNVSLPYKVIHAGVVASGDDAYIVYGLEGPSMGDDGINTIIKFNIKTKQISVITPNGSDYIYGFGCSLVNNKIYTFGGGRERPGYQGTTTSYVYCYDLLTNQVTKESYQAPFSNGGVRISHTIGNKNYICGVQRDSDDSTGRYICISDPLNKTSVFVQGATAYSWTQAQAVFNNKIYCFGGSTYRGGSITAYKGIWCFDTLTNKSEQISANAFDGFPGFYPTLYAFTAFGKIYLVSITDAYSAVFDPNTNVLTKLDYSITNLPRNGNLLNVNNMLYVLGGDGTTGITLLKVNKELAANHLTISTEGSLSNEELVSVYNGKASNIKIKPIGVYLGDENNVAQLIPAYKFDSTKNAWVDLCNGSVMADMRAALNVLGVN